MIINNSVSQGLYPINYLRNVALNNSVTDYVFLSDVDFIPVPGLHPYLQQNIEKGLLEQKDVSLRFSYNFHSMSLQKIVIQNVAKM